MDRVLPDAVEALRIASAEALEPALAAPRFLLFKHSFRCGISVDAFEEFLRWSEGHPEIPAGWIDVVASRELARAVAERLGVTHQSPQVLLLETGSVRWHASHGRITRAALEQAPTRG